MINTVSDYAFVGHALTDFVFTVDVLDSTFYKGRFFTFKGETTFTQTEK